MFGFRPLFLTLVALILASVHPAASHPIRTPKWIKTDQFEDSQSRGIWKVFEKDDSIHGPELPQAIHSQTPLQTKNHDDPTIERGPPGRHYKRDSSSGKSIVSVLVPVSPSSAQSQQHHHHYSQDEQEDSYLRLKSITTHKTSHYGQILGHPHGQNNALHDEETTTTTFSTASLKLASGQSISFFSYRITLPFLNFASSSFPQFQLPGVFTTVMVLLAMVWIAIVMIGLVEFGNYLWKRRHVAVLAAECDQDMSGEPDAESMEMVKVPLRVVVGSSGASRDAYPDEDGALLSSASESEDGSDAERDDYRF